MTVRTVACLGLPVAIVQIVAIGFNAHAGNVSGAVAVAVSLAFMTTSCSYIFGKHHARRP